MLIRINTANSKTQLKHPNTDKLPCVENGSCFVLLGRPGTPLQRSIIFDTVLDDPRMPLDVVQRNPLLGVQDKQLYY